MAFLFPITNPDQRVFLAFAVVFALVPVCMVGLRILARRIANRSLGLSDWLMVSAAGLLVIYQGVNISAVIVGGLGLHVSEIIEKYRIATGQETFIKHLLAMQCLWCTDLVLVKLAILTLYAKIFEMRSFIILAKVTGVLIILWAVSMIVGSALICQPISFYWDHTTPGGFCGDYYALWLTTGVLNIVTDLVVLLLPMPHLYGLSMARYKKVVLMATFGMGLITCVISAIRLWSLLRFQQTDATYSTIPSALLSQLEPSLLITLGCIPLLRPLLGRNYSSRGTARYINSRSSRVVTPGLSAKGAGGGSSSNPRPRSRFQKMTDETLLASESDETRLRPEGYSAQVDHRDPESSERAREEGSQEEGGSEGGSIELGSLGSMGSIAVTKTWRVQEETLNFGGE